MIARSFAQTVAQPYVIALSQATPVSTFPHLIGQEDWPFTTENSIPSRANLFAYLKLFSIEAKQLLETDEKIK